MSLEAFEQAAKDADEGLPAFFGRIMQLAEAGKLGTFVAVFEEKDLDPHDGYTDGSRLSYWTCEGTTLLSALGVAAYLKHVLLASVEEDEDD